MSVTDERLSLITTVLNNTVPEVDETLKAYIAQVVDTEDKIDEDVLYEAFADTLLWFKAVKNDDEALALCKKIYTGLQKYNAIPEVSEEERAKLLMKKEKRRLNGWRVARENDRKHITPGLSVLGRFAADGMFYPATIDKLTPDGGFVITFTGYGNSECVDLRDLKIPGDLLAVKLEKRRELLNSGKTESEMTLEELMLMEDDEEVDTEEVATDQVKPLPQPLRIADFGEKEPEKDHQEDSGMSKLDEIVSKKDIRAAQKEKRKMDLARQREIKRAEREKQLKEDALKLYLSSSTQGRSTNVDIHVHGYNMTSPDGSKELLQNATFSLNQGRIYGLIGSNGVGKTTLLKALAHYEVPGVPAHLRVVHVEQECRGDHLSALQTVLQADVEREILLHEERRLRKILAETTGEDGDNATVPVPAAADGEDAKWAELQSLLMQDSAADVTQRLQQVYARMEAIDAWGAEARAANILAGLQFSRERMNTATNCLSGGWRMRVSLACSLFVQPDLLLLDEPTNHLDFPAVLWLEQYLCEYPKTVVVISHDRMFLNNVITDVLHLYRKTLTCYKGDYSTFEKVRADQLRTQQRQFEAQQAKIAHMQEFIDKNRFNASRAALVQSRIKTIKKMDTVEEVEEETEFTMEFPSPGDDLNGQSAMEVNNISFSYPHRDSLAVSGLEGKMDEEGDIDVPQPDTAAKVAPPAPVDRKHYLLKDVTVNVTCESRVGILGANGIGKTTLLKIMLGQLQPTEGSVYRNGSARIATFTQHHMDKLQGNLTPLEQLMELFPKNHPQTIRRHLGRFGVNGPMQTQVISSMSGGQKSRVAFAIMMWDKPHVIIMDEPTNHLDLETVDALIGAVQAFKGGVVVVSHDQHFLASVCKDYWAVAGGTVKRFTEFTDAKKFSYSAVAGI